MKALKYILIGIICLAVIFLVLGLILPKEFTVARSTVISAPRPVVLAQIKSLKTMDTWTVWSKRDPDIKQEFGGTDGEVGSWLSWDSEKSEVGKGKQEVMAITDNSVDLQLSMDGMKPADVNFALADTAEATKVTWTLNGKMPFPWNALGLFMDMDKMVGPDFEAGLAGLKTMAEEAAAHKTYRGYEVNEINFEPKVYIAKRATVKFNDVGPFFGKSVAEVFAATGEAGLQPAGAPCGLYFSLDVEKGQTDMAVGVPVAGGTAIPAMKGLKQYNAEGKALHIAYLGAYDKFEAAHGAMDDYMKEKNLTPSSFVIEEYAIGSSTEKDTTKWVTNIYYLVK